MTDAPRAQFVDGLRVTALHLNHLQWAALRAVADLREIVGHGRIGAGLRLVEDAGSVTVSAGVGFTPGGRAALRARPWRGGSARRPAGMQD